MEGGWQCWLISDTWDIQTAKTTIREKQESKQGEKAVPQTSWIIHYSQGQECGQGELRAVPLLDQVPPGVLDQLGLPGRLDEVVVFVVHILHLPSG